MRFLETVLLEEFYYVRLVLKLVFLICIYLFTHCYNIVFFLHYEDVFHSHWNGL